MPKSAARQTILRQWQLLKILPTRPPGLSTHDLKQRLDDEGFAVTKRTVERDLRDLSSHCALMCDESEMPYRWHWMDQRGLDLPGGIEVADAVALTLVDDLLRKLLPTSLLGVLTPKFEQAHRVLDSLQKENRYARWTDQVRYVSPTLSFLPPAIPPSVLKGVQDALLQNMQIEIRYTKPDDAKSSEQTLHPLALIQHGPVSYLVATAFDYQDQRLYALHRMRSVNLTTTPAKRPKGFSIDEFLKDGRMEFGEGDTIKLKASVSPKLAYYLAESQLSGDQKLTNAERPVLTATVKDSWQLSFWIMSQGAEIEILSPNHLRGRIGQALQAAATPYLRSSQKAPKNKAGKP